MVTWLEERWRDLRFALRSLARTPGFTSIALLVIAAGIGVNTAIRIASGDSVRFCTSHQIARLYM